MFFRCLVRFGVGTALCLAISASGFAQYTPGTPGAGSTGGSGGGYGSSGAAIGAGVAAAAGAGILYLALRNRGSLVGCVEQAEDGLALKSEKDKHTYALAAGNVDLKPGQRVALKGKKIKDGVGKLSFQVRKLEKTYGACSPMMAAH